MRKMELFSATIYAGVGLASLIQVFGALAMSRLRAYPFAVLGCLAAMCNLVCCFAGLPIGIWCLFVLHSPEVRAAFNST